MAALLLGLLFFKVSLDISGRDAVFPRSVAVGLMALAAVDLIKLIFGRQQDEETGADTPEGAGNRGLWVALAVLLVSFVVMATAGFVAGVVVLLGVGSWLLGAARAAGIAAFTLIGTVIALYLFGELLSLPLQLWPWS